MIVPGFVTLSQLPAGHRALLRKLAKPDHYLTRGFRGIFVVRNKDGQRVLKEGVTYPTVQKLIAAGYLRKQGTSIVASAETIDLFTAHDQRG